MTVNELRDFIFERIVFVKESNYYSIKRLKRKYLLLIATMFPEQVMVKVIIAFYVVIQEKF